MMNRTEKGGRTGQSAVPGWCTDSGEYLADEAPTSTRKTPRKGRPGRSGQNGTAGSPYRMIRLPEDSAVGPERRTWADPSA